MRNINPAIRLVICFFLFLLVGGCAQIKSVVKRTPSSNVVKTMPSTNLVNQYIASARKFEDQGDLVKALNEYQLALTVDSKNQYAIKKIGQLRSELNELSEKHYSEGMSYHKEGKYSQAQQEFLTALRYNPDNTKSMKMLKEQKTFGQEVEGYLVHKIQADESLSLLAKKYYGDTMKFQAIAAYNQMNDATKIIPGKEIKIPVLYGSFFFKSPEEKIILSGNIPESELTNIINVKNVITHIVQPGESLSKIAMKYYGNYDNFPLLAQYNQLPEDTNLKVGREIMVPEILGEPFVEGKKETTEHAAEKVPEKQPVANNQQITEDRAHALDLFKANKFGDAIIAFKKVLDQKPDDPASLKYISASHFQQGLILFGKGEYLAARGNFQKSLQYNGHCEKCGDYIKECENTYLDAHYKKGIVYFRNEELEKAVKEWELVYNMAPHYRDVESDLTKVRSLIKRLDSIKRSEMEKDKK